MASRSTKRLGSRNRNRNRNRNRQTTRRSLYRTMNGGVALNIHNAVKDGDVPEVTRLIAAGADVNKASRNGYTPLYTASQKGYIEVVKLLVAAGANINKASKDGYTALYAASENGHTEVVKLLLAAGTDVNKTGYDALYIASAYGYIEIVKLLLAAGADVNKVSSTGYTSLYLASQKGHIEVVKLLLAAGADVNKATTAGNIPLNIASKFGHIEVVKLLLADGANINKASTDGYTPLYTASENRNTEVVKLLLAAGADVNKATTTGNTPLYVASQKGYIEFVKLLLAAGADVNVTRNDGQTPLYLASFNGHIEVVKLLLAAGADVNVTTNDGHTPLHVASQSGHIELAKLLLAVGADVNRVSSTGYTSLHIASFNGHTEVVKLLLAAGADMNKVSRNGYTALYLASSNGHIEVVKLLLAAGADLSIRANNGKLAIDAAKTDEIRKLLEPPKPKPTGPELKWQGWTQGDASMLDGIFSDEDTAQNFALCPVCMKYVIRSDACMYMSHNCSGSKGYYHNKLYDTYKNNEGIINWCTICGRICKGHNHFELGSAKGTRPAIIMGKDPFAKDCIGEGGGGIPEKLLRFRRLREYARDLQDEVGKIGWWEAMDELCEEMWNAPLARSRALVKMQAEKKFNIPNNVFPITLPPVENAPNVPYFVNTNTNTNKASKLPIVHPVETDTMTNALFIDDSNILQFQHKRPDGTWNRHDGPGQQISREAFLMKLKTLLENPTAEEFGKCWQYATVAQQSRMTDAEKALVCNATLHPEEVKAALDMTDPEQVKLAEGYRKTFNAIFDIRKMYRP